MQINRLKTMFVLVLLFAAVSVSGQQQYRSITALKFNYYTDDRSSLEYEEVFIIPLVKQYYLITAVLGNTSDFEAALGGKIGLAFDLPGLYYGEAAYTYERKFDDPAESWLNTLYGSVSYETGGIRASLSLSGELSDETRGIKLSPGLNYLVRPDLELYAKYFSASNLYDDDQYFNHAIWTGTEYEILPTIWLHAGGTFGTVYEPDNSYEKWSAIAGIRILPIPDLTIRYQFEYEVNPLYEIVSNGIVADYKF
ncbi:hypothetical protein [Marispirochaeta sp.]|uniref:hypothetical protein n=1 Tax=Marispirochaeta sp. TaxID=2038653 RepID=UPI0029C8FFC6|nr:hypothetical protein [Marispirochaeta sp.]